MRKNAGEVTLVIILAALISSCGGLFDANRGSFSPPDWIIGTWADTLEVNTFTFTSDDINYNTESSFKEIYSLGNVLEEKSTDLYDVKITMMWANVGHYRFEKTSETTLDFTLYTDIDTTDTIELIKQ
jgi:hypothetical protein